MRLAAIAGFRLVSQQPEQLARFYVALGLEADGTTPIDNAELRLLGIGGIGERWSLRLGDARVSIDRFEQAGRPYPAGADAASPCFQHLALVTTDIDASWSRAVAAGAVAISRDGPVTLPVSAGGVSAVKFRDPDGHPLELIHFPDAAVQGWHGQGIVGIDHSAIAVTDCERSEAFYKDLGLSRGHPRLNHGLTQVALDGLDDVVVDVVPLMPLQPTPHLELLRYRTSIGTPCEPWASNDTVATRIVWTGATPALLRDPDGHLHQIE